MTVPVTGGYVARLQAAEPFETWGILRAAAELRFWDGLVLGAAQTAHEAGAIYMLGYTAEMLLKAAYCEVGGLGVGMPAYPFLSANSVVTHNLSRLTRALVAARTTALNPMAASLAGDLRLHVAAVETNREVVMRYHSLPATPEELEETYAGVEWLRLNYGRLVR